MSTKENITLTNVFLLTENGSSYMFSRIITALILYRFINLFNY